MLTESTSDLMKIGAIKNKSGVPIKTIRYYEGIGIIRASKRTEGGFRLFSRDVIPRLHFIKRAQLLGFSLDEIKSILEIHDRGEVPCKEVKQAIEEKISEIEEKIHTLTELREYLSGLISKESVPDRNIENIICPIIQNES